MRTDDNQNLTVYRRDYKPAPFLVDAVALRFDLGAEDVDVHATLRIRRNPEAPAETDLILDCDGQPLLAISLDDVALPDSAYDLSERSLRVRAVPDVFELTTHTRVRPADNTQLEGLYQSGDFYLTQCEAEGFRRITFFPDRPDVMASFHTRIEADRERFPVLLGNGNPDGEGALDDGRHWAAWDDPFPKPCYLFAMVAGRLASLDDRFTTADGRDVMLRIWSEPENIPRCGHAMRALQDAMAWDERRYGLSYDLSQYNIVVTNDFTMGAMENKGLNIFNAHYVLASPETATDRDYQNIEAVIGHEYFHNWTGNRVTCRDWFQLSLKEGLTVFRDQEFTADQHAPALKRIEDVRLLRGLQFDEDAGPMAHPVRPDSYIEINNFYTLTVYEKGAEVVRMYQTLLGRDGFRRGMDLYFERHDGQAVTCDDFRHAMATANGRDLTQFERWYRQAGTPELNVEGEYDGDAGRYALTVVQQTPPTPGQPVKEALHLPLAVGLLDENGNDMVLRHPDDGELVGSTCTLELTEERHTFVFEGVPTRPVPSLLRNFSAPVKLKFDYDDRELAFLMGHDSDAFNRWDAAQRLALRVLVQGVTALRQGDAPDLPETYRNAFLRVLADDESDPSLRAVTLDLPDESVVADALDVIHVEPLHGARRWLAHTLGLAAEAELVARYEQACGTLGAYSNDAEAVSLRAYKNRCLGYLVATGQQEHHDRAWQQFESADNMTDALFALTALVHEQAPQAERALAAFEARWRDDPLVMDKWFRLQAVDSRPEALDVVRQLMQHPAFSLRNPNKVRSVIGAFAHGNARGMHREDGAGYAFVADQILAVDQLNPQVASRVAGAFNRWRRYPPGLQALMRAQLERIVAAPELSPDVAEICGKALAA